MASKFNFISDIEKDVKKKKYQCFEVKMGFETIDVMVPFEKAELFEEAANKEQPKSTASLKSLLKKFNGVIE
jgi:hypothetical protein